MDLSGLEDMISGGANAINQAPQSQVDSHRGFLADALSMVTQQGGNPMNLMNQAQVGTMDPQNMNAEEMVRSTLALARNHPQIVESLAAQYPEAQPLVGAILGNANAAAQSGGGGLFGNLLSRIGF